jgi:hypothetical protein
MHEIEEISKFNNYLSAYRSLNIVFKLEQQADYGTATFGGNCVY